MNRKQISTPSFLEIGQGHLKNPTSWKISWSHKKKKTSFNRQYNESYLKYGFILTGDFKASCTLCLIYNSKL